MAIGSEAEVHDVETAELAEPQLVGVGPFLTPHGEGRVGRAHPVEQGLAGEPVVRRRVIERHAALVAPVDVDLPPVDLGAAHLGEVLVAPPGRSAT